MKILKCPDCEVTSPPSNCFLFYPECESDLAFIAELVDLPNANRAASHLFQTHVAQDEIAKIVNAGRTSRCGIQSLIAHLQDSPMSSEEYARQIIKVGTEFAGVDEDTLLRKSFWVRTFWF